MLKTSLRFRFGHRRWAQIVLFMSLGGGWLLFPHLRRYQAELVFPSGKAVCAEALALTLVSEGGGRRSLRMRLDLPSHLRRWELSLSAGQHRLEGYLECSLGTLSQIRPRALQIQEDRVIPLRFHGRCECSEPPE